jgi:hypothetical protein
VFESESGAHFYGGVRHMPDESNKPVTCDEATAEQRAAARERFRRKLAEADARHTPEYFAELRARFGFPERSQ